MTIDVVAQPANTPPRFQITITTPNLEAVTAVTLYRNTSGGTVATRVQPIPGPSPLIVFDYECPWDSPVTYSATVVRGGVTETYVAATSILSPTFPWMIHPTAPALSLILDQNSFAAMGVISIGDETRSALTTKHRILGAEYQVVTKLGSRAAPTLEIVLATVTAAERAALVSILRDQTPLLIQVPASWGWDFDGGYYDVGDFTTGRILQYGPEPRRSSTLQLERVEAPAGTQQSPRTWANMLSAFAGWQDVSARYATWADVLTDSRR